MRIGIGYDVHRLVNGCPLILGGVTIPHETGLLGHSDADVLIHAVIDAILGAAGKRDIGFHFPDTNDEFKGISSLRLLEKTRSIITDFKISNIDSIIIAQAPKLSSFLPQMQENIAAVLRISASQVNVKATTEEGLGVTGEKLGISAQAVCLLEERRSKFL